MMPEIVCKKNLEKEGCYFVENEHYQYYDEYSYMYGYQGEWFWVYADTKNGKGIRMNTETFKNHFYDKKELLNKKLKKLKKYESISNTI